MSLQRKNLPTRRRVIGGLAVSLATLARAQASSRSAPPSDGWRELTAAPGSVRLRPDAASETPVWTFDGQVPGPTLRVRPGEQVRVRLRNQIERPLSLHWHGVRNVSAMDGVGGLTQPPVAPGQSFDYRFTPPDAGTFLVRPLVIGGSSEPAERGLSALLVVEERQPPKVDHEFALLVDDWRLGEDGALAPFGDPLEASAAGRLGNWLTVNGKGVPYEIKVAPGARVRLRLANGCNARSLRIRFDNIKAYVAAVDGQPTDTFEPLRSTLPLAPGGRYDLLFDAPANAGARNTVSAVLGPGIPLVVFVTEGDPARNAPSPMAALPENKQLPREIRLQSALRRDVVIQGGAKAGPGGQPVYTGDPKRIWTINGVPGAAASPPLFTAKRGSPVVLSLKNQTPVVQVMHVHGHAVRLLHLADDGWDPYWLDTVQIPENRTLLIAFVADNPGKWALSSAVLERFDTGLWTWFEVT
ncbi:MAG TPA: multicopper oxidase family protein [Beijerinckiaceae bacterium]|nr:multicopper oxidase family protein [Beijerinckiaceae bacterium]